MKKRFPELKEKFKIHNASNSILNLFPGIKFNVILSNQVLYYLDDDNLENMLTEIDELLAEEGYVFLTMMGKSNSYYQDAIPINRENQALREVSLKGRVNEKNIINFINNEDHLKFKFKQFEPVFCG